MEKDIDDKAEAQEKPGAGPNRLIREKSPYLLQHARNPVDWRPWGDEAFDEARRQSKPVFLSIGYSTCHWCHVMERESFEDTEVAAAMNDAFIPVKVDREERPDIDSVYMAAARLMSGQTGWPLNIIMTPDKKPFFAATYIPKHGRFGMAGIIELTAHVKRLWQEERDDMVESSERIAEALVGMERQPEGSTGTPGPDALRQAYRELSMAFDPSRGGFGGAPKFPTPHNIIFLLRYWKRTGDAHALEMAEKTLMEMRLGGIYDHVGFGFHRYSTDPDWLVPHFEKMLYDQALLLNAYTEAYQATGKDFYRETAREIITYVMRDMTSGDGAFFSAEDADSEGREGKFYLWSEAGLKEAAGAEAALVKEFFGVREGGNFRDEAGGAGTGLNILHQRRTPEEFAADKGMQPAALAKRLEEARERLFAARRARVHPMKDDKVLTDWNGLMIAALARAGAAFDDGDIVRAARRAADFVLANLRADGGGGLLHRFRQGEAALDGSLADYAFMVWALIELYEATFDPAYLNDALELNSAALERFRDDGGGGFFFTPADGERLLFRQKEIYDGATPSGNSVSMMNLLRLAAVTGSGGLSDRAEALARFFCAQVEGLPSAHTHFLCAVDFALSPSLRVVIAGDADRDDARSLLMALRHEYLPNMAVILRPAEGDISALKRAIPGVEQYDTIGGRAAAYVCIDGSCREPVTDADALAVLLKEGEHS